MVEAVIFDLDGTLVDSTYAHYKSFRDVLHAKLGLNLTYDEFRELFGKGAVPIIKEYVERNGIIKTGLDYEQLAQEKQELFRGEYIAQVSVLPGVECLLNDLDAADVKLAVASNSPRINVEKMMDVTGFGRYFNVVVTFDDIDKPKPNPQIFLNAAKKLMVGPQDCAVVEDSVMGIVAGSRAHMKTVAVLTGGAQRVEMENLNPDLLFENLESAEPGIIQAL